MVDHHSMKTWMCGRYGYHGVYYTWNIHMENMDVWWIIIHGYIYCKKW